jgi:hypothetical protein
MNATHTKESFAEMLNGRQMGHEITKAEAAKARQNGLLVVFGYSDDNAEFRGIFEDEIGCCDGDTIIVTQNGITIPPDRDEREVLAKFGVLEQVKNAGKKIEAVWGKGDYSWTYKTSLPHATFDIMEGAEKFCRGIVIDSKDLPTP